MTSVYRWGWGEGGKGAAFWGWVDAGITPNQFVPKSICAGIKSKSALYEQCASKNALGFKSPVNSRPEYIFKSGNPAHGCKAVREDFTLKLSDKKTISRADTFSGPGLLNKEKAAPSKSGNKTIKPKVIKQ